MTEAIPNKGYLEDEWYQVRHSGEIPEIALHSSIHYLTKDQDGPAITLTTEDLHYLLDAVSARYLEIILRDILPENRDLSLYRGVLRTISNWRRFKRFCEKHRLDYSFIKKKVADQFLLFLRNEIDDVCAKQRESSINCTYDDIVSFAYEMNISLQDLENELKELCLDF